MLQNELNKHISFSVEFGRLLLSNYREKQVNDIEAVPKEVPF